MALATAVVGFSGGIADWEASPFGVMKLDRVVVTNDDGFGAAGLEALAEAARQIFSEVWIFAPKNQASQVGHRVTTAEPLAVERRGDQRFAVDGSPADCVRAAFQLMPKAPRWVWSGINHGGNLGWHDYFISGTVAAAREGVLLGACGLAASHYLKEELELNWPLAGKRVLRSFQAVLERIAESGEGGAASLWNVNLPHLETGCGDEPEIVFCKPEIAPLPVNFTESEGGETLKYAGKYADRPRSEDSDVAVCFGGQVAVSRIDWPK